MVSFDFLKPAQEPPMTMRNAVVEVIVERGDKSYDFSAVHGLANSLSMMKMDLLADGTASSVELTYNPPFDVAVDLIESGILGTGLSPQAIKKVNEQKFSFATSLLEATSPFKSLSSNKSVKNFGDSKISGGDIPEVVPILSHLGIALKVRWWYEEMGSKHISPIFYGTMGIPRITLGEEISLTISATSTIESASTINDVRTSHKAISVHNIVQNLAERLKVQVEWSEAGKKDAIARILNEQQDINDLMYLHEICVRIGCMVFVTGNDKGQVINVISRKDLYDTNPICTLAMYTQIDVNGDPPIYPIMSVDANIAHTQIPNARGVVGNEVNMDEKKSTIRPTEPNKDVKNLGQTTSALNVQRDNQTTKQAQFLSANKHQAVKNVAVTANSDHKTDGNEDINAWNDDMASKAFEMTLTGPAFPFVVPGHLVKINIGDIKALSGIYYLSGVSWVIDGNGAEATYTVVCETGLHKPSDLGLVENKKPPTAVSKKKSTGISSLVGGVIK